MQNQRETGCLGFASECAPMARPEFSRVASRYNERRFYDANTYRELIPAPTRETTTWLGPFWGSWCKNRSSKTDAQHSETTSPNSQQLQTPP